MKGYKEHPDKVCCRALTADCLACAEGVSVAEYCLRRPNTVGCPGKFLLSDVIYFEYTNLIKYISFQRLRLNIFKYIIF